MGLATGYSQLLADVETALQLLYGVLHVGVVFNALFDGFGGVYDCGMIAPTELITDRRKRGLGVLAAKIHGDLSWQCDILRSSFCFEIADFYIEEITDRFLNILDRYFSLRALERVAQDFLCQF
jgi:hypothetical protein